MRFNEFAQKCPGQVRIVEKFQAVEGIFQVGVGVDTRVEMGTAVVGGSAAGIIVDVGGGCSIAVAIAATTAAAAWGAPTATTGRLPGGFYCGRRHRWCVFGQCH